MDFKEAGSIGNVLWSQTNPNLFLFTTGIPSQIWSGKITNNGFEKKQVTLYGGQSPNWAPDGKNVIYVNNKQIWIVNIDTGEEIPLLNGILPVYGENPCWSY
jgi:Tol biopolymer transport system component